MLKIKVWYKNVNGESANRELRNLKPRSYMCSWEFSRLLKYIKDNLYWDEIDENLVEVIEIVNEKEHWFQSVSRNG